MRFIDKLERKYGKFGIPDLTIYIVICYVIGYVLQMFNSSILDMLSLEPAYILKGQIWRLVTWVIYPPSNNSVLWFALMILFFYYPIGTSLERTIGTFKYTLYIFSGMLFTVIGAFVLYFILGGNYLIGGLFTTYYISLSTFLAYAMCYPDMKDFSRYNPKEVHRRNEFRRAMEPQGRMKSGSGSISKHKCAICGRTELDDPNLEFRFCSRCNGNYEYCQDHLFTHTHVK